jgi:hypothetical protein
MDCVRLDIAESHPQRHLSASCPRLTRVHEPSAQLLGTVDDAPRPDLVSPRTATSSYLAGDKLNLATLGAALAQAGVVTAMELDFHSGLQFFSKWQGDGASQPQPQRLLPTMVGAGQHYVQPDIRDFFYFTTLGGSSASPN